MLSFYTEKRVGRGRKEERKKIPSHQYSEKVENRGQSWQPQWIKDKTFELMFYPHFEQTYKE